MHHRLRRGKQIFHIRVGGRVVARRSEPKRTRQQKAPAREIRKRTRPPIGLDVISNLKLPIQSGIAVGIAAIGSNGAKLDGEPGIKKSQPTFAMS